MRKCTFSLFMSPKEKSRWRSPRDPISLTLSGVSPLVKAPIIFATITKAREAVSLLMMQYPLTKERNLNQCQLISWPMINIQVTTKAHGSGHRAPCYNEEPNVLILHFQSHKEYFSSLWRDQYLWSASVVFTTQLQKQTQVLGFLETQRSSLCVSLWDFSKRFHSLCAFLNA